MSEFFNHFFQVFAASGNSAYVLECLFLGLFLTLLAGFSYFESRSQTPSLWFSLALASVGIFFYSLSIQPFWHLSLFLSSFVIPPVTYFCLIMAVRFFSSTEPQALKKLRHLIILFSILVTILFSLNTFLFVSGYGLVLNGIITLSLIALTFEIQKNHPLSLLKIFCFALPIAAIFLMTFLTLPPIFNYLPNSELSPLQILFIATIETTLLFWAYWLRKYWTQQFQANPQNSRHKPIFPQSNTTQFNPFSDEQDFLQSAANKLSGFKEFRMLSAGAISENEKSINLYQWNAHGEKEMLRKLPIPPQILESLTSFSGPIQRLEIELSAFHSELSNFLRQCTAWESCDFILPIHREKKTALLMFFSSIFPSRATNQIAQLIIDIHTAFEPLFMISETIQNERELQPLLLETRERKVSYESLSSKINDIHTTLSDLEFRQSELIQSERWISISQITVTLNHEINNPLTHVLGTAQLLQMKLSKNQPLTNAQFQQNLKAISEQTLRIVEIVKSLRRLSVPVVEKYLPEIDMIKLDISPIPSKE